ncbi:MAG: hypothetical protein C3F13_08285 [Anaerolineales bacterium]|nr:MAG: hypothetical protein C3F13_08285 [Anaerolineales bacterium]
MAFTHALYYPWIEIYDPAWLKTAILYWEKISTIVPGNYPENYQSQDCEFLRQQNILIPEFVQPWDPCVREASENFLDYLQAPEATRILLPAGSKYQQLPALNTTTELSKLNRYKIGENLAQELIASGKVIQNGEWLIFDKSSVIYYMTLLSASIAREKGYSPLTHLEWYENLNNRVKRGDNPKSEGKKLGEALLARMALQTVKVGPDTPLESLINFREKYSDELGRFRAEVGRLAKDIDPNVQSMDALEQHVHDIFTNNIQPAINTLTIRLKENNIRSVASHLFSAIFAISPNLITPNPPLSIALLGGSEIIFNRLNYLLDRKDELLANPYSYVLYAQREFS